jgi:molybdopterin/thiamine biosynthesis adenylyltransferase
MGKEWSTLETIHTVSQTSIRIRGHAIPGAEHRQKDIPGFDQQLFSRSRVLCIGAGGLASHITPALVRKGIGALTILDDDIVEVSNLNRQRFYEQDLGKNKAIALVENLQYECIYRTQLAGYALTFQEALLSGADLDCDLVICGVDNNPTRTAASQYFRNHNRPVIFTAVSSDADHGYVFVQETRGPCFGCIFPDGANDDRFPCPGTPAIIDILQAVGSLTTYAVDSCLMARPRAWNYRALSLSDGTLNSSRQDKIRPDCPLRGLPH